MGLPAGPQTGFSQGLYEVVPIDVIRENVVALIATAHEVVHRSGILDSKLARHERLIGATDLIVNRKCGAFLRSDRRSDPTDAWEDQQCEERAELGSFHSFCSFTSLI